jgi:hypothetical protein
VSKATIGSPLTLAIALTVALALAGCDKSPPAAGAAAPGTPPVIGPATSPHPMPTASTAPVDVSGIVKAEGGRTVAEVFAEKDQLAGKPVVFRGKVVKSNPGILGKNWIHVRDGSGAEGSNDITVTTVSAQPKVGDTVLVAGAVVLNKDYGMGYQYDVIIEDADVKIETPASL